MREQQTWTATIEEDGECSVIDLPDELIELLGWEIGDELIIEETDICNEIGELAGVVVYRKGDPR
jgi:bifunctional DNA-binding transcriptional regulator/antitoxin component of YhaV-PrlF toxin-antitoxin module